MYNYSKELEYLQVAEIAILTLIVEGRADDNYTEALRYIQDQKREVLNFGE